MFVSMCEVRRDFFSHIKNSRFALKSVSVKKKMYPMLCVHGPCTIGCIQPLIDSFLCVVMTIEVAIQILVFAPTRIANNLSYLVSKFANSTLAKLLILNRPLIFYFITKKINIILFVTVL